MLPVSVEGRARVGGQTSADPADRHLEQRTLDQIVGRSQLQLIIAGLTDGVILVDPDQSLAWANQAALAMHGVVSIDDLGADVTEYRRNFQLNYRNNHAVDAGEYPIERVVTGEAFDDVVVEVTPAGKDKPEWVHRIRSLVINDAKGHPDCLVLIIKDATDRYQAEERFQRTFAANPAPAIICRLADLRYVKVNQGFLEMTGWRREDLLGRSSYEIDLLAKAERRQLGVERLAAGETIPQMEATLDLPDGATREVIVAGQPLEVGNEACMLFTFADLDRQKKAEAALRRNEERFEKAFMSAPVPIMLLRLEGLAFVAVNAAFAKVFKVSEVDVVGRGMGELELWVSADALARFRRAAVETGAVSATEECLRSSAGEDLDCLVTAETVTIAEEACLLCSVLDITDRKRTERDLTAAIDKVMADTSWFSRGLIEKLAEMRGMNRRQDPSARDEQVESLSKRERQVLQCICRGDSDATMASALEVSHHTIRNHIASLYRKLGVHNRTEAALWGHARGFAL